MHLQNDRLSKLLKVQACLGTTVTNQNCVHKGITSRLKGMLDAIQLKMFSLPVFLPENLRIEIYLQIMHNYNVGVSTKGRTYVDGV
jgi:hypothetical protein